MLNNKSANYLTY